MLFCRAGPRELPRIPFLAAIARRKIRGARLPARGSFVASGPV
jgi:hypothetical protein